MAKRAGSPMLKGDFSALFGYLAGLGRLGDALHKRRGIQRKMRVPVEYIEEMLTKNRSILDEIDLRGRPSAPKEGGGS
jgi:hypothetical protein